MHVPRTKQVSILFFFFLKGKDELTLRHGKKQGALGKQSIILVSSFCTKGVFFCSQR